MGKSTLRISQSRSSSTTSPPVDPEPDRVPAISSSTSPNDYRVRSAVRLGKSVVTIRLVVSCFQRGPASPTPGIADFGEVGLQIRTRLSDDEMLPIFDRYRLTSLRNPDLSQRPQIRRCFADNCNRHQPQAHRAGLKQRSQCESLPREMQNNNILRGGSSSIRGRPRCRAARAIVRE